MYLFFKTGNRCVLIKKSQKKVHSDVLESIRTLFFADYPGVKKEPYRELFLRETAPIVYIYIKKSIKCITSCDLYLCYFSTVVISVYQIHLDQRVRLIQFLNVMNIKFFLFLNYKKKALQKGQSATHFRCIRENARLGLLYPSEEQLQRKFSRYTRFSLFYLNYAYN